MTFSNFPQDCYQEAPRKKEPKTIKSKHKKENIYICKREIAKVVTLKQLNQISDTQESSTQSLRGFHATLGVTWCLTQRLSNLLNGERIRTWRQRNKKMLIERKK